MTDLPDNKASEDFASEALDDYARAKALRAEGLDPETYCPANKHRWAETLELRPIPGTDNFEPYCSACEQRASPATI